jgi:two-component system LytT family response regulator
MIKVILIDDEPLAVSVVREYLKYHTDFEIVGECHNGFEGIKSIQLHQPDLIFLDVQMPKINGFEMLEVTDHRPHVIFTTAFDQYAIKAFELNAIDYLLKPFNRERFDKAIGKFRELIAGNVSPQKNQPGETLEKLSSPIARQHQRMVVKSGNNIRILPFEDILYVEAHDDYVLIHIDGDCFMKKQTMQQTEELLGTDKFLRVHRSYIVRLGEITRIEPSGKESFTGILRNKVSIPLSKTGYQKLRLVLGI